MFFLDIIQKCTEASWHHHYYTFLNKLFGLGFIYMLFHDILFFYSLTATQTLTFGYIKFSPYFTFTVSFLDIVFGMYFRQGMGKKTATKNAELVYRHQFLSAILPMVSCPFREKWEAGEWKKVIFRIIFKVLLKLYVEIILEATISRDFSYPDEEYYGSLI